ncbi:iron uptake transporter deferrochelatase/peroxidase subunit [Streptomyces sp. TP-A0874]|uniref:iron uptake transporter deferrochelatase/peroxidase subunit n=1 Tax=Streptomyces sp. TP-A0874 TaxID=549819 RepID=UPI000853648B|nr:iron uptake transporter deferrochelatase/peroxidase subunit [Streptomyces sp. TP-A0874]
MTDSTTPSSANRGPDRAGRGFSRRRLLTAVGAAGLGTGAAVGAVAGAAAREDSPALATVGSTSVAFHGRHQAGITTPLQSSGHLIAFDLAPETTRRAVAALLRRWSGTAERLMAGESTADDTSVARDAGPSSLTVTFGFGRSFFARTGLEKQRPAALDPLPDFSSDALDPQRGEGDLWVQIGADDALVAFHALRAVQKDARGVARVRWQMNGFNRSAGATAQPMTMRNLMGQVDGTNNPEPGQDDFEQRIFVPSGGGDRHPAWMADGSYVVFRRIRMLLDDWEALRQSEQERVIGRRKADGAPLTGGSETTPLDLEKTDAEGRPVVPANAHARISAPAANGGAAMLRRPFSYHDGFDPEGAPDAGLLFICWQADPLKGFVPVQRKLDRGDALSAFIRHEASGLFAVPGGCGPGEYVGQRLLEG